MNYEATRKWVNGWDAAGKALEKVKEDEIRKADTLVAIRSFEGLLPSILKSHPPVAWSGLVEQQKVFARLRDE